MEPKNPPFVPSLVEAVHDDNMNPFLYIPPSPFLPIPYHSIPTPAEGQLAYSPSTPHANTRHRPTPLTDTSLSPNHGFEPGIAFINTPPLTGYLVEGVSSGLNSVGYTSPLPVHQPRAAYSAQRPLTTKNERENTRFMPYYYAGVTYRKKRRPPATYAADTEVVVERCRADGGDEDAIALLPGIFSNGVTEEALIRKMTREEAHKYPVGECPKIYQTLLRSNETGRFHCRLCAVGADEGGWKKPRDALRHLKRDHFGIGDTCIQCGKVMYTAGEMTRHRCKVATGSLKAPA